MSTRLEIRISGMPAAAKAVAIGELQTLLSQAADVSSCKVVKEDQSTQDLGTTIVLIAGTAAATQLSRGIGDWLRKRNSAKISISADGKLVAENIDSRTTLDLVKFMGSKARNA